MHNSLKYEQKKKFRRRVKILIPQMEKSEIVNPFKIESYPRKTIYDTINRMQLGGTINEKKKTGRLKARDSQFGYLNKRMLRETLSSFISLPLF